MQPVHGLTANMPHPPPECRNKRLRNHRRLRPFLCPLSLWQQLAQPTKPATGLANEAGVQQALAKVSSAQPISPEWLKRAVDDTLTWIKSANGSFNGVSALGEASSESSGPWTGAPEMPNNGQGKRSLVCVKNVIHRSFQPLQSAGLR
jgi:hypothetical protein